jgi:hypothetical protein
MPLRIHPRYFVTRKAKHELVEAFYQIAEKHELTPAELLSVVNEAASEHITHAVNLLLRQERHGTTEKKANEA